MGLANRQYWSYSIRMSKPSSATLTALAISVDCPSCGESLPDPSGSLFWTPPELASAIANQPDRVCDSCDEPFVLRQQNKAHLLLEIPVQPTRVLGKCEHRGPEGHDDPCGSPTKAIAHTASGDLQVCGRHGNTWAVRGVSVTAIGVRS